MFGDVIYHRLKYFLTPQLDLYQNVARWLRAKVWNSQSGVRSICDYGCGNGVGSVMLLGAGDNVGTGVPAHFSHQVVVDGIDNDPLAIEFANHVFGHIVTFRNQDWSVTGEPERACFYDAVVCIEVIEHVADPERLLKALRAAVKERGGAAIISTLNHNSQYRKNDAHVGRFCVADFRELVNIYFPGARVTDYLLEHELFDDSSITPMVAVWQDKK